MGCYPLREATSSLLVMMELPKRHATSLETGQPARTNGLVPTGPAAAFERAGPTRKSAFSAMIIQGPVTESEEGNGAGHPQKQSRGCRRARRLGGGTLQDLCHRPGALGPESAGPARPLSEPAARRWHEQACAKSRRHLQVSSGRLRLAATTPPQATAATGTEAEGPRHRPRSNLARLRRADLTLIGQHSREPRG